MKTSAITGVLILAMSVCFLTAGCDPNGAFGGRDNDDLTSKKRFTIVLSTFSGPEHVYGAKLYKKRTEKNPGWRNLFVINQDDRSVLCWGKYYRVADAQKNLKKAKAFKTPNTSIGLFKSATVRTIPGQEVSIPKELDLKEAPGEYSVLVAVFFDESGTKSGAKPYFGHTERRAITVCKQLREKGYDAYCYFDPSRSGVTIGAFPLGSVRTSNRRHIPINSNKHIYIKREEVVNPQMHRVLADFPNMIVNELTDTITRRNDLTGKVVTDDDGVPLVDGYQPTYPICISDVRGEGVLLAPQQNEEPYTFTEWNTPGMYR